MDIIYDFFALMGDIILSVEKYPVCYTCHIKV